MCFLFFPFLIFAYDDKAKFVGNWSIDVKINDSIETEVSYFEVSFENSNIIDGINWSDCSFVFSHTKNIHLTSQRIFAYALFFPFYNSYFIFQMYPLFKHKNDTYAFFNAIIKEQMEKENFSFYALHDAFLESFLKRRILAQLLSFNATLHTLFDSQINEHTLIIKGTQTRSKYNVSFIAKIIDTKAFSRRCAIFGTFYAISLLLRYHGWKFLSETFTTENSCNKLSYISILSNSLFDFAFCIYILNVTLRDDMNKSLVLDIIFEMGIYMVYESSVTGRLQYLRMREQQEMPKCLKSMIFILFHLIMIFLYLISFHLMSQYPLISILFSNLFLIPQILRSFLESTRKKNDTKYIITITIYRILFLIYFGMYSDNIVGVVYPKEALIGIVLLIIQSTIILMQNQYGGRFFVPPSLTHNIYNYFGHQVEEGAICSICLNPITESDVQQRKVMTTPCNHSFHAECLSRWMEDESVCPFCRSPLP